MARRERAAMTHKGLRDLVQRTVASLNAMGIGRNDRVAIVLPNGPEMAAAFIAIACGATTAPLNPAYRTEEFDFYLSDLNAKALVILEGMESPALAVAAARNIPVIRLVPGDVAGDFTLAAGAKPRAGRARRLCRRRRYRHGAAHLGHHLAAQDRAPHPHQYHRLGASYRPHPEPDAWRCLPQHHAAVSYSRPDRRDAFQHGGGRLGGLHPRLQCAEILRLVRGGRPTWYTAVPTMHQAILTRAERNREIIEKGRLRLIRSSSSSLPPQVMEALEKTFHVPVVEAYGMTEASHQMASNPLPPHPRFAGSVGMAAGPDVAIMDEAGALLPAGGLGEVVIRGRNVTKGYEANPDANAKAFTNGWFRTGDQGVIDEAGYLRLTGRLKELINRGGEKISPLEVDTVIMDHPAVAQVVTFGGAARHAGRGCCRRRGAARRRGMR